MAIPNFAVVATAKQAADDRIIRIALAANHPKYAWYCIAGFIAILSLINVVSLITHAFSNRRGQAATTTPLRSDISLSRLPLAAVNSFRAIAFRSTFQIGSYYSLNVAELFLTAAYINLVFIWALVNTTNVEGVKYDPKYWANIAANIVTTQLPLMVALGTKNNIIAYLTGIGYEKLNYFHRMIARVLWVLICVHASGRITIGLVGTLSLQYIWVHCGVLALSAFTTLCIVSIRPLRKRNYNTFLVVHFLMAFIILLAAYFHARGVGEGNHIWPAFVIWGLDRAIRVIRIVASNTGYFQKGSPEQFGRIEVLSPTFVRVTLQRPTYLRWRPGQNAYLTIPNASSWLFESHPFTIAAIDAPREAYVVKGNEKDSDSKEYSSSEQEYEGKILTFLIGVRSGFTKRLLDAVDKTQEMKVIIDGPYGSPPRLRGCAKQGATDCRKVVFIWAVRDPSSIGCVLDAILPALTNTPPHLAVEIRLHITSIAGDGQLDEINAGGVVPPHAKFPGLATLKGRPDLKHIIEQEIAQNNGAISVNGALELIIT
ncbi:hypothetical protein DXG01_007481 [Tephrocybe rancida]|nr:hypothetical protein DXG01_007481 [Tephrocybe rancida]